MTATPIDRVCQSLLGIETPNMRWLRQAAAELRRQREVEAAEIARQTREKK